MPSRARGPALALLEIDSLARGMRCVDAVLKRAPVEILRAEQVTPGKYLLLFGGGVAEAQESLSAGKELADERLVDELFLAVAADGLWAGLEGRFHPQIAESVGLVETQSVGSCLLGADAAMKRGEVQLLRLDLARGIGGKGLFAVTGSLDMVQAAVEAAAEVISPPLLLTVETIEHPHLESHPPLLTRPGG